MKAKLDLLRKAKPGETVYSDDEDGDEIGTIKTIKSSAYFGKVMIEYTNGKSEIYPYNKRLTCLPDDDTLEEI